jgi:hypothetical protein
MSAAKAREEEEEEVGTGMARAPAIWMRLVSGQFGHLSMRGRRARPGPAMDRRIAPGIGGPSRGCDGAGIGGTLRGRAGDLAARRASRRARDRGGGTRIGARGPLPSWVRARCAPPGPCNRQKGPEMTTAPEIPIRLRCSPPVSRRSSPRRRGAGPGRYRHRWRRHAELHRASARDARHDGGGFHGARRQRGRHARRRGSSRPRKRPG